MANQSSGGGGGTRSRTSSTTDQYYSGSSGYGTGSQAGSKRVSKPKTKPNIVRNTAGYYSGSSGYGTGAQAGVSGVKATPKKDEKKKTGNPNKVNDYWGRGQSGYGSGPNRGTGGHQSAAQRRAEAGGGKYEHSPFPGATKAERLKIARADRDRRDRKVGGSPESQLDEKAKNNENAYFNYRQARRQAGDYRGKYYGPDIFKGNEQKLARWRAAGSPKDKSKFA